MSWRKKTTKDPLRGPEAEEELRKTIDDAIKRMAGPAEAAYFRPLLEELVRNNTIPVELLNFIPVRPVDANKTKFDQLYDAAMSLVFPSYRPETLQGLIGPHAEVYPGLKVWRVALPEKFGVSHVLLRADSFQQAFALGCDYACRMHLRIFKKIPVDLTVRVMFMSERAIRRKIDIRWANRVVKRKQLQLETRVYTAKEMVGARNSALGRLKDQSYSIARYVETEDLKYLRQRTSVTKTSAVENEVLKGSFCLESSKKPPAE